MNKNRSNIKDKKTNLFLNSEEKQDMQVKTQIKIKASVNTLQDIDVLVCKIREIEKEYNYNCTLLDLILETTL